MIRNAILAAAFVFAAPAFAQTAAPKAGGPDHLPPHVAAPATIPAPGVATAPAAMHPLAPSVKMAAEAQRLDLNAATVEQLSAVKGFDKTIAEAIVKARPFKSVDDLTTKKIITGDIFATVKDQLIVR
jgi:competence protein ComEA